MSAVQLEAAATVLGPLVEEVVFIGGATIYLWLTDPSAPPPRFTEDVDVICEVVSRAEYHRLGSRLRERGLREAPEEPVICRWKSAEPSLVLDVMPTDPDVLGSSNPWYDEAISTAATIALDSGAEIRAATPPVLLATKLAAWKGRGGGDVLRSLDVHDVLTLFDGRPELVSELKDGPGDLCSYIRDELAQLHALPFFDYAIDSVTAGYGPVAADRAGLLRERLHVFAFPC